MRYNMPDMTADNAVKDSSEFGLRYAQYIDSQWMSGDYAAMRDNIALIRSHMMGTVDVSKFKPMFMKNADKSGISVNWKYSSEVPRFAVPITEGFSYDMYRTSVKAVDLYSQDKKTRFKREKQKDMYGAEATKLVKDTFGYDMSPTGFVPKSNDELNLYMELEYKMAQEIAMEIGIQKVLDINDWREVFNNVCEDLVLTRYGYVGVTYDPCKAVEIERIAPEQMIFSRDSKNTRDKRGCYYFAKVSRMTISEIEKLADGKLTPEQIKSLGRKAGGRYTSFGEMSAADKEEYVEVLNFTFKANRYNMLKKKGNKHGTYKYINKEDTWTSNPEGQSLALRMPYEVWYEGTYVCGTEIVLNYKLMDNMMRDPNNPRRVLPPYIMYELSTESVANKIIDISDDIYLTKIQLRRFILKMKPKGIAIDLTGLGGFEMNDGTRLTEIEQVRMYKEDGDLLYNGRSLIDRETGSGARLPISDIPDPDGRQLAELVNVHNALIQQLHEVTGINAQALGGEPPARTSASVYQGTVSSSQKVVNNIYNALLSIQQRTSEVIVSRLQSAAMFKETKPIVETILGEYTADMIEEIASLNNYKFVHNIDVRPTDEDRAKFSQDLSLALQTQSITIADKIDIDNIDNIKLGIQMIKIRQIENMKEAQRMAQLVHQRNLQMQQAKSEGDIQSQQMIAQIDTQKTMAEYEAKANLEMFKAKAEMEKITLQMQWLMAIEREKNNNKQSQDAYKEDRKDDRLSQQSTQQSKLIEQRQNQEPATSFVEPEIPDFSNIGKMPQQQ